MKSVLAITALLSVASVVLGDDNPWATYPSVAKTASINGFADKIYDSLPSCAQACVKQNTGITPCPYWDTGCLCVMPQFSGLIAQCIVDNCKGNDVVQATSLATSICSSAGVWEPYWMIPASLTTELANAAAETAEAETTAEETTEADTTTEETTTEEDETAAAETETTKADSTEEAETTTTAPTTTAPTTTAATTTANETTAESQENEDEAVESENGTASEVNENTEETTAASEVAVSEENSTSASEAAPSSEHSVEQANVGANNYPGALFGGLVAGLGLLL